MALDDDMQTFRTKVRTNGNRIRKMTDEELAESLSGSVPCRYITSCLDTSCYECTLKWIKQEVHENDEWRQAKSDDD